MNTQMYPFLRIAIVLVAGIMTGDVLYGHVSVRLVLWILVALVCATVVVYKKADGKKLTTLLLMLDVFVLGIWNVGGWSSGWMCLSIGVRRCMTLLLRNGPL